MKRFRQSLYLQVITAVIIGVFVGHFCDDELAPGRGGPVPTLAPVTP